MSKLNVVIVGAGGVGGYFGARLCESDIANVTFLLRKSEANDQGLPNGTSRCNIS